MSNETKQTTVDQIVNLLNKEGFVPVLTEEEIKFFKEMEKEQMIQAWKKGDGQFDKVSDKMSLEYYKKEYGGKK